jgi:hypothetical protein
MADATRRERHDWEAQMASVSLAGIRPLVTDHVTVGAGGSNTYTISNNQLTKRLVVFHDANGNKVIYFSLDAAATTDDMPIVPGIYFVLEVEQGETLYLYNDGGTSIHVHVMEIR